MAADSMAARPGEGATIIYLADRRAGQASAPGWAIQLAASCETLARTSPRTIAATTLTGRLEGRPGEVAWLHRTIEVMADLYGLVAEVDVGGRTFMVRLRRRPILVAIDREEGAARPPWPSWLGWLLG